MQLNRTEFLRAIKFLKPAIANNETRKNLMHLHLKAFDNRIIMTAADAFIAKRVTLYQVQTTDQPDFVNQDFMIFTDTLESFEKLCSKHKSKLKSKIKNDPSYNVISVEPDFLESNGVEIGYKQPALDYPNLDKLFESKQKATVRIGFNPQFLKKAIDGFPADTVKSYLSGEDGSIYFEQDEIIEFYQAVLMPTKISKWGDDE